MWCDKSGVSIQQKNIRIYLRKYPSFRKMEKNRLDCKFKFYLSENIYIYICKDIYMILYKYTQVHDTKIYNRIYKIWKNTKHKHMV